MNAFDDTEKEMFGWTEQLVREARDYVKWSNGDDFDEDVFQEAMGVVTVQNNEALQRIDKFYDDEIARLSDKLDGLEPEEPEPVVN